MRRGRENGGRWDRAQLSYVTGKHDRCGRSHAGKVQRNEGRKDRAENRECSDTETEWTWKEQREGATQTDSTMQEYVQRQPSNGVESTGKREQSIKAGAR